MDAALLIDTSLVQQLWPLMRITGVMLVAPIYGSAYIPIRLRAVIAILLTVAVMPYTSDIPDVAILSPMFFVVLMREILIGVAMGFVLRLIIDAAVLGGQALAISMGLHFATVVDPNQGGTPTVSQFYVIIATLLLIASNAHLAFIEVLAESFIALPIAPARLPVDSAWLVISFAGNMFVSGLQLALPAIVAILMINVAFGVVSRAAPTLNLFAVGLPITMTAGFVISLIAIADIYPVWQQLTMEAFSTMTQILGGG